LYDLYEILFYLEQILAALEGSVKVKIISFGKELFFLQRVSD
jgi:hypothetical protein